MKPEEPPVNNPRAILGLLGSLHETIERLKVGEGLEYQSNDDMRRVSEAVVEWIKRVGGLPKEDAKLGTAGIVELILRHHAVIKDHVEHYAGKVGCFGVPAVAMNTFAALRQSAENWSSVMGALSAWRQSIGPVVEDVTDVDWVKCIIADHAIMVDIAKKHGPCDPFSASKHIGEIVTALEGKQSTAHPVTPQPVVAVWNALDAWYDGVGRSECPLPAHEQIANILSDHSQAVQILREARNRVHFTDVHVEVKRMVAEASLKELTAKPNTADPVPMCALEVERIHDLLRCFDGASGFDSNASAYKKVAWLKGYHEKVSKENNECRFKESAEHTRLIEENLGLKALVESRKKEHEEFRAKALADRARLVDEFETFKKNSTNNRIRLINKIATLARENRRHITPPVDLNTLPDNWFDGVELKHISDLLIARYEDKLDSFTVVGRVQWLMALEEKLSQENREYAIGVEKMKADLSDATNSIEELRQKNGSLHETVTLLTPDRERVLELAERYGKYKQHRGPLVISDFVNHLIDNLIDAKARIARLSPNEPNP